MPPIPPIRCAGAVLAGGQSRRMGSDKAALPFGPETLLERAIRLLQESVQPVVVVHPAVAGDTPAPRSVGASLRSAVIHVSDLAPGVGPLEGIRVALSVAADRADAVFICGCDAPFLQPAFVRRVFELLEDREIAVPCVDGYEHSLAAVYRTTLLPCIEAMLAAGERRLGLLLERASTRRIAREELLDADPQLDSLVNLNTPADYLAALARCGFGPPAGAWGRSFC